MLFVHYGDEWFRGSEQVLFDLVTHLDRERIEPIVWCNGKDLADATTGAGLRTYRTAFAYYLDYDSPRFSLSRYRALVREGVALIRRHDVQVIHANSAAPNQWMIPAGRIARRPVLAHLHIDYRRRGRYVCLLHQASMIVGVSRHVTQDFLRDGTPPGRIHTIYNGIDFARLGNAPRHDLRAHLGIAPNSVLLATAGSLVRRKGHDLLLRALAALMPGREIKLVIAGDGPERAALAALTDELGLRDRVSFLGHQGNVANIYRAADIMVMPSRADAFGLVLAEAGYFSLPAVGTSVGGIPEVIADGETGVIVPPDDVPALTEAIRRLSDDPDYRRRLGQAAHERVRRLFTVEQMVAAFHAAYDCLADLPHERLGWFGQDLSLTPYRRLAFSD